MVAGRGPQPALQASELVTASRDHVCPLEREGQHAGIQEMPFIFITTRRLAQHTSWGLINYGDFAFHFAEVWGVGGRVVSAGLPCGCDPGALPTPRFTQPEGQSPALEAQRGQVGTSLGSAWSRAHFHARVCSSRCPMGPRG